MDLPVKPGEADCCHSGCNPCILDVYEEQLKKFNNRNKLNLQKSGKNCISATSYTVFKVVNFQKQGDDAFLYTFQYVRPVKLQNEPMDNLCVLYKPGQYFLLKGSINNNEFTRAYTPIPSETYPDLEFMAIIKLYEGGKMSDLIRSFKIGGETLWRGPYGNFTVTYNHKYMLLVAQGTGIAPLYTIICDIIKHEDCYALMKLFFCCNRNNTIYLRSQLYDLQSNWNFSYEVFLSNIENMSEKYNETVHGYKLNINAIRTYLADKYDNIQILICGSENFMTCIKDYMIECNVNEQNIVLF